jgi:large repetitive protein
VAGTPASPTVTIVEGPAINRVENNDGIQTLVALPVGAKAGDVLSMEVTRPDGSTFSVSHTVTPSEAISGTSPVTLPGQSVQSNAFAGAGYVVIATLTDAAGNASSPSPNAVFTVDTVAPTGTPAITIPDAAPDGLINAAEVTASGGVPVSVTIPAGTEVGDTVTLTLTLPNGGTQTLTHTVTAADLTAGTTSILVPQALLVSDGVYSVVSAGISDASGNQSAASAPELFTLDRFAPGADPALSGLVRPAITLTEGPVVNVAENNDGISIAVALPKGSAVGDHLSLSVTRPDGSSFSINHTLTSDEISAGTADVLVPPQSVQSADFGGAAYQVGATVTDAAGNTSLPASTQNFNLDTLSPLPGSITSRRIAGLGLALQRR